MKSTATKPIFQIIIHALAIFTIAACNRSPDQKMINAPKTESIPQRLPVKNMHDDLFMLWSAIKELHPGYGNYTSADSLKKAYDKAYSSIREPLTETEFMAQVYPFLCQLRCGHTQLEHSAGYQAPKVPAAVHLPFEVLVRHHRAWITTHQTGKLNTGDEIVRINDVPVSEIIDHGYDLYCGDGYNETFKELFLSEYDGFEDACNKYYHWKGPYQITLRTKQGVLKNIYADPALNDAASQTNRKEVDNFTDWTLAKNTGRLPLRFLNKSPTALLTTLPFEYQDTAIYKEDFKQIHQKGIKNLVIDMRHNTGGDIRVAGRLLSYLADSPFSIVKDAKSRIPNLALNHFAKYFDSARTSNFNLGYKTGNKEGTWYHMETRPAFGKLYGRLPLAKADHFNGKVFVLIDGATFSSGALFTAALKAQCRNVKFIGRETAGVEEGPNGMVIQKLTLPNTRIVVGFPLMRVVSVAKNPAFGRGMMPDYKVDYQPEDMISKKDLDLERVLGLIK